MRISPFKDQDYYELINSYNSEDLFEDETFDADDSSLYFSKSTPPGIVWLRPQVK